MVNTKVNVVLLCQRHKFYSHHLIFKTSISKGIHHIKRFEIVRLILKIKMKIEMKKRERIFIFSLYFYRFIYFAVETVEAVETVKTVDECLNKP